MKYDILVCKGRAWRSIYWPTYSPYSLGSLTAIGYKLTRWWSSTSSVITTGRARRTGWWPGTSRCSRARLRWCPGAHFGTSKTPRNGSSQVARHALRVVGGLWRSIAQMDLMFMYVYVDISSSWLQERPRADVLPPFGSCL